MPTLTYSHGITEQVPYRDAVLIDAILQQDESRLKSFSAEEIEKGEAIAIKVTNVEFDPKKSRRPWETRKLGQHNVTED